MKSKDLIRILQIVDPESCVTFTLGKNEEYREKCAKAQLADGGCLDNLVIDYVNIYTDEEIWSDIVLKQENLIYFDESAQKFDKIYLKQEVS